jgi:hypothetical protein
MLGPGLVQGLAGGVVEAVLAIGAIAAVGGEVENAVGEALLLPLLPFWEKGVGGMRGNFSR